MLFRSLAFYEIREKDRRLSNRVVACAISMERDNLVDPHDALHAVFSARLTGFAKVQEDTWSNVDSMTSLVRGVSRRFFIRGTRVAVWIRIDEEDRTRSLTVRENE